jgi:hypothetical protein
LSKKSSDCIEFTYECVGTDYEPLIQAMVRVFGLEHLEQESSDTPQEPIHEAVA